MAVKDYFCKQCEKLCSSCQQKLHKHHAPKKTVSKKASPRGRGIPSTPGIKARNITYEQQIGDRRTWFFWRENPPNWNQKYTGYIDERLGIKAVNFIIQEIRRGNARQVLDWVEK